MGGPPKRSGGRGDGGGQRKRGKYLPPGKTGSGHAIPHGAVGILFTCDSGREDRAGDEMVALIEEHYDKLKAGDDGKAAAGGADAGGGDIAAALAAEVAQLKDKKQRRFHVINTGVRSCVFVHFPNEEGAPTPLAVVHAICDEAVSTLTLRSRYAARLMPVTHVGFAGLEEMKALAEKMLPAHFPKDSEPGLGFAVDFEHRGADKMERLAVINAFVDHVPTPPHKVNLGAPDKTILVQLIRNVCASGVMTRYKELHKFNLRRCAGVEDEQGKPKPAPAVAKPAEATEAPAAKLAEAEAAPAAEPAAAAAGEGGAE